MAVESRSFRIAGLFALWLGVPPSSLYLVLPNVGNSFTPGTTGPRGFLA